MKRYAAIALAVFMFASMLAPLGADAWYADFFEDGASGNATYEAMVIAPQASYDATSNTTYIVYQGKNLDPYITAYDHGTDAWLGTYRVGVNPHTTDPHGGPAIFLDPQGYIHVLFGAHNTRPLLHARSRRPYDISAWVQAGALKWDESGTGFFATYPQPSIDASGGVWLFFRRGNQPNGQPGDAGLDWQFIRSIDSSSGAIAWSVAETVLDAMPTTPTPQPNDTWYADSHLDREGRLHVAFVLRDASSTDPFVREHLYYLYRDTDGTYRNADGEQIEIPWTRGSAGPSCTVSDLTGEQVNQVVVEVDVDGRPGILYLAGTHAPSPSYYWKFAHRVGGAWEQATITSTDNFFDAGTFEFQDDGSIEAFLTCGGLPDDQAIPAEADYATRGGNIERWVSNDGGSTWPVRSELKQSKDASARYNNPQIVSGGSDDARLVFSEWNNDAANFIHKVYLWGSSGFKQRQFTPGILRLQGGNRIETAAAISRQSYPSGLPKDGIYAGTSTVILASAWSFPDVLCGVPLAQAYRAPVLLVNADNLPIATANELKRLGGSSIGRVVILGGEASVGPGVAQAVRKITGKDPERIGGADRYETSAMIARRLSEVRPDPQDVLVASGDNFPDALSVSPYAARKGYPIILTPPGALSRHSEAAIIDVGASRATIIGGQVAVGPDVETRLRSLVSSVDRWKGENRYETSAEVVRRSLDAGLTMERFALASGQDFADAVTGGAYAARINGVMLIHPPQPTTPGRLHYAIAGLLDEKGQRVLTAYVLGGPVAVSPDVENQLAITLSYLDGK